jgi:carbonic anhydrase
VDTIHVNLGATMTTTMTPLLQHNEHFALTYTPVPLGRPAAHVIIVTCLDHRVDPAITLGLKLGDAPVLRNAGGRVTRPVIEEIAYLAFLGQRMSGGQLTDDSRLEVAIIHHTQCGTGLLADPGFRHEASKATGVDEAALESSAVTDPRATVSTDVERLLTSPSLPPNMGVSGHVYDVETGRITTIVDTRYTEPAGQSVSTSGPDPTSSGSQP